MTQRYAMLVLPSTNRVYSAASETLALMELQCMNEAVLDEKLSDMRYTIIGGVNYLVFSSESLSDTDIEYLSNLSFFYALFALAENTVETAPTNTPASQANLTPIGKRALDRYPDDLLTILKFAGKTNELFTKMLLNVSLMASSTAKQMINHKLSVLDPVCGRGTTLNQALMYGYDAAGIEIDQQDFDAYEVFIKRWLKDKRYKHKANRIELNHAGKSRAHRVDIRFANDKAAYKAGDVQTIQMVQADTARSTEFYKRDSFNLIVADLPYGVKHNNKSLDKQTRSPLALLEQALPSWLQLLQHGGAIGIAFNTYLAKKSELLSLFESCGLTIYSPTGGADFRHRVDQAIIRDILVARR